MRAISATPNLAATLEGPDQMMQRVGDFFRITQTRDCARYVRFIRHARMAHDARHSSHISTHLLPYLACHVMPESIYNLWIKGVFYASRGHVNSATRLSGQRPR